MDKKDRNAQIASNIRKYIKENNITQKELAEKIQISPSTLSDYMNLRSNPSHGVIQKLADYFGVKKSDIDTTFKEEQPNDKIITIYNKLEPKRQKKVYNFAEAQLEQQNKVINLFDHKETVEVTAKVSAGTGITWLGDSTYDKEVTSKPKHYDEAFEINGDSMTPLFKDGEIIFVEHTEIVENGQIAVVQIDEESFIKKVYIEEDKMRLVSLNKDYKDIVAGDDCDIRIVGKVIM